MLPAVVGVLGIPGEASGVNQRRGAELICGRWEFKRPALRVEIPGNPPTKCGNRPLPWLDFRIPILVDGTMECFSSFCVSYISR